MATSEAGLIEKLVSGLTEALKQGKGKPSTQRPIKLSKFHGKPTKVGDSTVREWLEEVDIYVQQCHIPEAERAQVIVQHLAGTARDEIKCHEGVKSDYKALVKVLHRHFGAEETVQSLQKALYDRTQHEDESLMDYSRSLMRLHDRVLEVAAESEKEGLKGLRDKVLINQFVAGARDQNVRLELRRIELAKPGQSFSEMRDCALELYRDIERVPRQRRTQVRQVRVEDDGEDNESAGPCDPREPAGAFVTKAIVEPKWQQILEQQQEMLKCIQGQQDQLSKLVEHVLKLESPKPWSNRPQVICYHCKGVGHIRAKCPLWLESQNKQIPTAQDKSDAACNGSPSGSQGLN